jgi:hypothetical protein
MRAEGTAGCITLAALAIAGCSGGSIVTPRSGDAAPDDAGADDAGAFDAAMADVCAAYASSADLSAPVVSFASDVLPLFSRSCGLSIQCHRSLDPQQSTGEWGAPLVYLGCVDSPSTVTFPCDDPNPGPDVYRALVGLRDGGLEAGPAVPVEIASMPFVTPGEPSKSYLMHKLDGDVCILQGCIPNNPLVLGTAGMVGVMSSWCGQQEPFLQGPLDEATRDLVRRWIAQGAKNN